jgi:uncharacterized membrane protein YkvA (DUF1232 family)
MTTAARADDGLPLQALGALVKRLPAYGRLALALGKDPRVSKPRRLAVMAGAANLVSPVDFVPGFVPVAGQLDNLFVALGAIRIALDGLKPDGREQRLAAAGLTQAELDADFKTTRAVGAWTVRSGVRVGRRLAGQVAGAGAHVRSRQLRALDPQAAARRWAETWQRGWNERDVNSIVALYAEGATFSSEPFREIEHGPAEVRRYVNAAFAEEEQPAARFGEPIVARNRAAVRWWATLLEAGQPITLAGTSILRFDANGLVVEQWDTWNQTSGRHDPPPGWD